MPVAENASNSVKIRLALVEDDPIVGNVLKTCLTGEGFLVDWFDRGLDAIRAMDKRKYDACILDWVLPDISGPDVMKEVMKARKTSKIPVIFITSKTSINDMTEMLNAGADDYVIKPVIMQVFIARLKAVLRRTDNLHKHSRQRWGGLEADFGNQSIFVDDNLAVLTKTETDLALCMLDNVGRLVTRDHLTQMVWHSTTAVNSRKIDVHLGRIRRKLEWTSERGWILSSVYGSGYRLEWLERA